MLELWKYPTESCQKRFLRVCEEVGLAPHPVTGLQIGEADNFPRALGLQIGEADNFPRALGLQIGEADNFPRALGLERVYLFPRVSKQDPCLTEIEENGDDKTLIQLKLPFQVGSKLVCRNEPF